MDKPAIIEGNYVDLRFMPGLKCARVSIDINIEESNVFLEMFRAPDRACPVRVVIARMADVAEPLPSAPYGAATPNDSGPGSSSTDELGTPLALAGKGQDKPRTPFREMLRSAQCALKCKDLAFQEWIQAQAADKLGIAFQSPEGAEADANRAAKALIGGIVSKADLDKWPEAGHRWSALLCDFDMRGISR